MLLKDKVIIVTGAARGLGRVFARRIAAEGGRVVCSDIIDGEGTAEEIRAAGGESVFIHSDVSREKDTEELARAANDQYGRIDGLVNNAALFVGLKPVPFDDHGPFEGFSMEEWDRVFDVNVKGVWLMSKAVYPHMKKGGHMKGAGGKIVNIASGTHFRGVTKPPHYVVSKGAVITMTRVLARTLGPHGICVNCIAPGLTRSDSLAAERGDSLAAEEEILIKGRAIPRGQLPEDLTGAIVFFLSGGADFIAGQTLIVDGGGHMG